MANKRLSDANALKAHVDSVSTHWLCEWDTLGVLGAIDNQPTVDAVVFPCKIGDEFWTEWVGIRKVRCSMLTQKADGSLKGRFTVENSGGASIDIAFGNSGKELFFTKEEAEAHFLKMDGDGNG